MVFVDTICSSQFCSVWSLDYWFLMNLDVSGSQRTVISPTNTSSKNTLRGNIARVIVIVIVIVFGLPLGSTSICGKWTRLHQYHSGMDFVPIITYLCLFWDIKESPK